MTGYPEAMGRSEAKRVLITGGTGFIGSHLAELLIRNGYSVTCLVRDQNALRWLAGLDIDVVVGDCSRPETLANAVQHVSIVVHAAGLTKARRPREYYEVNHIGTRNMLEACSRYNPAIEKFILISSLAAAGPAREGKPVKDSDLARPISDYGRSKRLAELEVVGCRDAFSTVILRPSVVYGPRDTDMFELFRWASRGVTLEIAGGERFLNFCYVGDLVQAISLAMERQTRSGNIYFVAEERPYSWSEVIRVLLSTGAVKARTIKVPYAAAYLIGLASELGSLFTARPALTNRQKVREASQQYWTCDLSVIERELGFKAAYPLQQGLEITWRWYRDNNWIS
jgi:nucleoside-diphosphate-sugar epimerase